MILKQIYNSRKKDMKLPNNLQKNEPVKSEIISISTDEMFLPENFYIEMPEDDPKLYIRGIRGLERIIRQSLEYKNFVRYLKQELNLSRCLFLPGIDQTNEKIGKDVTVELHHYPFTLYDITDTVVRKEIAKGNYPIDRFHVCNLITLIHYQLKVGLVPLSSTAHELAHSGSIFIHLNQVHGNYKEFFKEFFPYIRDELKESLETIETMSQAMDVESMKDSSSVLDTRIRILEVTNRDTIKPLAVRNEATEELKEIKSDG